MLFGAFSAGSCLGHSVLVELKDRLVPSDGGKMLLLSGPALYFFHLKLLLPVFKSIQFQVSEQDFKF